MKTDPGPSGSLADEDFSSSSEMTSTGRRFGYL